MVVSNMAGSGEVWLLFFLDSIFFALRVSSIVLYQFKDSGKSALALMIGSLMSLVSRFMLIEFSASSVSWLVSFTTLQRKIFIYIASYRIQIIVCTL